MVNRGKAVRSGDWKYHQKKYFTLKQERGDESSPAHYNLREDIGETNNVIDQYPEIAAGLEAALNQHIQRIKQHR